MRSWCGTTPAAEQGGRRHRGGRESSKRGRHAWLLGRIPQASIHKLTSAGAAARGSGAAPGRPAPAAPGAQSRRATRCR